MKDLFTLGDDEEGTETGDIFAGTGAKEIKAGEATRNGNEEGPIEVNQGEKTEQNGNASLLNSLLDDLDEGALHSTINHDDIIGAGTTVDDTSLVEYEADRIAEAAYEEVKISAAQRQRQSVSMPTWTGRSGLAGLVGRGSGQPGTSKGSSLLNKIRAREGTSGVQTAGAATGDATSPVTTESLMAGLIDFFKERNGECTSDDVVNRFQEKVRRSGQGVGIFKSMLKRIARLDKGGGPGGVSIWKLKEDAIAEEI